jgi:exopolysaccharide biosynthesis polyprenyl glycosylphosphotransferase
MTGDPREAGGPPELGPLGDLDYVLRTYAIDRVIIAPSARDNDETLDTIRLVKALGVKVSVLPRLFEVVGSAVEFDDLDGIPLLGLRRQGLPFSSRILKRMTDVIGASVILFFLAPALALIAIAIKLDSRGPVLFRQNRVGRHGRCFRLLKFRTMCEDAEQRAEELRRYSKDPDWLHLDEDPRLTRMGRLLRPLSLDELPQLWNVLRGEMSLVGPRPLIVEEDQQVAGWHRRRLHLMPGMTGPWQVLSSATVRVPLQDMVTIDYLYVTNWSLWLDIKILARTIAHVLLRRGV